MGIRKYEYSIVSFTFDTSSFVVLVLSCVKTYAMFWYNTGIEKKKA